MVGKELSSVNLLLIATFLGLFSCIPSNPDGFININCGAIDNLMDNNGLLWLSDSTFIKTRNVSMLRSTRMNKLQFLTFAYFTNLAAKKYCYLIPVKSGVNYLVRASFYPDSTSYLAKFFDLSIEGIKWMSVELSDLVSSTDYKYYEIILAAKSDFLSLCLARNSQTEENRFVFITSIELRQFESSMYNSTDFQKQALNSIDLQRENFGASSIYDNVHYPNDPMDRYWYSDLASSLGDNNTVDVAIEDSRSKFLGNELWNKPPVFVLRTAIAKKAVDNMTIKGVFPYMPTPGPYFFSFYFCNINKTKLTVEFALYINEYQMSDFLQFKFLQCRQVNQILQIPAPDFVNVTLLPSATSQLGPFINGAEMFSVLDVQTTTQPEDVVSIRKIAEAINVPDDWTGGDPCLPADHSSTGITCSQEVPPRVIIMNLTNMHLVGAIPTNIADLTALTQLLLGNNNLSGPIPDLSSLKNLKILQLQNNQLTGEIPSSLEKLQVLSQLFLQGNKLDGTVSQVLVRSNIDLRVDPQNNITSGSLIKNITSGGHKIRSWEIGLLIACLVVLVLVFLSAIFLWRLKHQWQPVLTTDVSITSQQNTSADEDNQNDYHRLAIEYTEKDIKIATNNYSTLIGKGTSGSVYHGTISGSDVAVKVLETDSNKAQREFQNEVAVLSRIYHKNLVSLIGYCRQSIMALVYDYMHCGTLKDHLYAVAKLETPLDWQTRLNIALQAAEGLLYLHRGCSPPIIHRDIKCSNILLDKKMFAKLADFGLSKLIESSNGYASTEVKGTIGYLDPEYFATLSLNEKSDVYSFGVVLLEIISGVSPNEGIVELAKRLLLCGKIADLVDSSLGGRYNVESAWKVAEIAYTCVDKESKNRPKMIVVVKELEEAVALARDDSNRSARVTTPSVDNSDTPSLR